MTETKERPIYRDKIVVDPDIVSSKYTHGYNNVDYYCYYESGKSTRNKPYIPKDPVKEFNSKSLCAKACFADLISTIHGTNYNRVLYHMKIDEGQPVKLLVKEMRRFVELAVEYKLLPPYITPESITNRKEGRIVIMLEGLTISQVYMYLTTFRYLREDTGFVKAILYLHDELDMNFYAAFVLGSHICMSDSLHHIIDKVRRYGGENDPNNLRIPFHVIAGLSRFARYPKSNDDRILLRVNNKHPKFNTTEIIQQISKIDVYLKAQELFDPKIERAINAKTDAVAMKYINKYLEMKKRIKFRQESNNE